MATYDHLPLRRLEGQFERRKQGFGMTPGRDGQHGSKIAHDIENTVAAFKALPSVDGIDPALILKIATTGGITEADWQALGLTVLAIDGDKSVILFANDLSLQEFRRRVEAYQGELPLNQIAQPYAKLVASIDHISLLGPADRIGRVLRADGFAQSSDFEPLLLYVLDIELHQPPTQDVAEVFIYRLGQTIGSDGGQILSTYSGKTMLIARVECSGQAVRAALELPEVSVIDLPPTPDVATAELVDIGLDVLTPGAAPSAAAVVIGIIDSGVNFGHPLLAPVEAGALSFDGGGSAADAYGHGTGVASIAAFGDIGARAQQDAFDGQFWIASARVLTDDGKFPKKLTLPELMDRSIRQLHTEFGCRIFNLSLGDAKRVFAGGKPDPWAAALDSLARELNILIIVSAGNRTNLGNSFGDGIIDAYPHFLLEPSSKIIEPATAANVLTVGAIAHGNGLDGDDDELAGVRPICGLEEPSPFSRAGPGVNGMLKPEFVDFGGNAVWDGPTNNVVSGQQKASAGIWTFSNKPLERLFEARSGTSFAAPNLAYKAGLLLTRFPQASANLLRSLLALSASVPAAVGKRIDGLDGKGIADTCGHGVANADHAANTDDGRVVFYAEDQLDLDHFAVYEVQIPKDFQTEKSAREIRVSLAFDPPVRHTRADYLGTTMAWRLLRGTSEQSVFDKFRIWAKGEGDPPEFPPRFTCDTSPGPKLREKGSLQTATYTGKVDISGYGDKYYVAVWCSRRWAPSDIVSQKFALSVQLRHENATTLYLTLTQPVKLPA